MQVKMRQKKYQNEWADIPTKGYISQNAGEIFMKNLTQKTINLI